MSGKGGVLPSQEIRRLVKEGSIYSDEQPTEESQIQPASFDPRLGFEISRLAAGFLPSEKETVQHNINRLAYKSFNALSKDQYILDRGFLLEKNAVYVIKLMEKLKIDDNICIRATPKSSTGRMDIFVRLIADRNPNYDFIQGPYEGPLYVEVVPLSHSVGIKPGVKLNQVKFKTETGRLNNSDLIELNKESPLVYDKSGNPLKPIIEDNGIILTVDLSDDIIVFKSKRYPTDLVDMSTDISREEDKYEIEDFWHTVKPRDNKWILEQDSFTLMSTYEYLQVLPRYVAEMEPYNLLTGEFRTHYAGFFDPGWGWSSDGVVKGTPATLEIRNRDSPFLLKHGQRICKFMFEELTAKPDKIYGENINSHYHKQRGSTLGKYFKQPINDK